MHNLSSNEIVNGILKNDKIVLHVIYRSYFGQVSRYVQRNHGSIEDAQDVFQEAIMVIFQKSKTTEFVLTCSFKSFLYTIVRYLWNAEVYKKHRTTRVDGDDFGNFDELEDLDHDTIRLIEETETKRFIQKHFSTLSDKCQLLLKLFIDRVPMKEISDLMGISEKFVKKKKFECKEKLIARIKNDPFYLEFFKDL
ncbi:MAG: sigma-70 family RNA polymerase sigma factor [Bacteroidales bacterium]|nr:sigma-70 family RNA polymerase sigma factor [Bacteroidales bacterium]